MHKAPTSSSTSPASHDALVRVVHRQSERYTSSRCRPPARGARRGPPTLVLACHACAHLTEQIVAICAAAKADFASCRAASDRRRRSRRDARAELVDGRNGPRNGRTLPQLGYRAPSSSTRRSRRRIGSSAAAGRARAAAAPPYRHEAVPKTAIASTAGNDGAAAAGQGAAAAAVGSRSPRPRALACALALSR